MIRMVPSCAEWRYDLKLRDTHIKGKNKFVLMDIPCGNFRMSKADKGASLVQLVAPPLHIVEASGSNWCESCQCRNNCRCVYVFILLRNPDLFARAGRETAKRFGEYKLTVSKLSAPHRRQTFHQIKDTNSGNVTEYNTPLDMFSRYIFSHSWCKLWCSFKSYPYFRLYKALLPKST